MKPLVVVLLAVLLVGGVALKKPRTTPSTPVGSPSPTVTLLKEQKGEKIFYFEARLSKQTATLSNLDIFLMGKNGESVDGADLTLEASKNLRIVNVFPGQTFRQYPRVFFTGEEAIITGIADLTASGALPGEANRLFASLVVEQIDPTLPASLQVNTAGTGAYFQGKPVLNQEQSLKKVTLK